MFKQSAAAPASTHERIVRVKSSTPSSSSRAVTLASNGRGLQLSLAGFTSSVSVYLLNTVVRHDSYHFSDL
jgi:hypothetical protein